ncbi:MAG TPA: serine hydrolase domain-containing protein [Thermoanaerobaculia bacterium]
MKRTVVTILSLLFAAVSFAQTGIHPPSCPDVVPAIPAACNTPGTWAAAAACLDAIAATHPTLFPGAVIGYQQDGGPMNLYAKGPGFATNSVVSLASVSKPFVSLGLVKLVQDHYASPACTPMTANCVFPQKFETPLVTALTKIDQLRGTDTVTRWFNRTAFDDATLQRSWKNQIRIKHILQMTSGFPPISFTGYVFCPGGVCPEVMEHDVTCNPDQPGACRQAYLYNQYLARRGPAIPNGCRPRPASGPRLFNFSTYYDGRVDAPYKLMREFERRYSYEPGLFNECVLQENSLGSAWVDSRTVHESEVAKFFLGMPLLSAPGTEYHYSQPNLYVSAYLIAGVTGQRFDDYLEAQLFAPLGMTDTSFVVAPGSPQHQRLADIKRIPTTPLRTLPDLASPVNLDSIYGTDKNWDELRGGWRNRWPEGGATSSAADLLRFLRFIRTGQAPDGRVLLNAESLQLVTTQVGPVGTRTYAFNSTGPGLIGGNGYFGTMMRRDLNRCTNLTVLPQIVTESPEGAPEHRVQLCNYQYGDVLHLRAALIRMIDGIPASCGPASPLEP